MNLLLFLLLHLLEGFRFLKDLIRNKSCKTLKQIISHEIVMRKQLRTIKPRIEARNFCVLPKLMSC